MSHCTYMGNCCTIAEDRIILRLFVVSSQLLSDLLAPVTDQVPEHISDYSNILSSRAHIKNSISARFQVGDALTADNQPSLNKTRHET